MKPIDVNNNTYINIDKEVNNKDPKFKVGDHVRISKYKNVFAKDQKKYLLLKKLRIQFHGIILLMILMMKKSLECSMKESYKKTQQ